MREVRVARQLGRGDGLVVIENIPMLKCRHCGEGYFTAQTLHMVEQIQAQREELPAVRDIPVITYPARPDQRS
jgi:YgiT-type zinc finger domain-containing protein